MAARFSLRQLEYMVAVGEAGSVLAASEKVNVSSSSISAAISQLEAELGVQLFVRQHAQGLSLTSGGQRFFNEAKRILHSVALLGDLANDIVDSVRGPISIGCLVTLAPLVGAAFRRSFTEEYPNVEVTMREGNQAELLTMLARAEIDVAIAYDLDIPASYDFEGLIDLPPQLILAADDPLADKADIPLRILSASQWFCSICRSAAPIFCHCFTNGGCARRLPSVHQICPVCAALLRMDLVMAC